MRTVKAKTELVIFTRNYKIPKLHQTCLTLSNQTKYLGVILDKKLHWTDNILERTRKAAIALFARKKDMGRKWGFSPVIVHWLYTAIVRPILLYENIVRWPSLENNCNLRIVHKIQTSAELCISGALRTTATEALHTILDLQPLDLLAQSWPSATPLRLREAPAWTTSFSSPNQISIPHVTDYFPPTVNFERRYKIFIPNRTDWDNLSLQFENAVNIYTDGSKLNSQIGGEVFSPELDTKVSFRLTDHCSVFPAELMAIQEAMSHLNTSEHHDTDIFILSDSQAALRALDSYTTNSTTISECRKSLNEMATHLRINLIWVPGHHVIEGNCIVDELARQAADILRDKDGYAHGYMQAPPQAETVHPLQQPKEHNLNMPQLQTYVAN